MERIEMPFSMLKRSNKPCFYVRFKNEKTGKYLSPKSTGQTNKTEAIKTAWEWYTNGIPQSGDRVKITNVELINTIKNTPLGKIEVKRVIKVLQQQGYIKTAVLTGEKADRDFIEYLLEFWDFERSPYVQEKLRRSHSIHRRYCLQKYRDIQRHWQSVFSGKLLGEITRQDLVDSDITQGIMYFSGNPAERYILTPEQATALFAINWTDNVAKLANLLACLTGMRCGEILGLRWQDLGENCIHIHHSWNELDGLKPPKNGETRTVQVPFPQIMQALRDLAQSNPHGQGLSGFVFYSDTIPDQPFDKKIFIKKLRVALRNIGMSETDSKKYTFHAWRHFYTSYMKDKINDKLLQSQTGHKSDRMLKHYSNHTINGDIERIHQAQLTAFSKLLPEKINSDFNLPKQERDAHGHFLAYNVKAA